MLYAGEVEDVRAMKSFHSSFATQTSSWREVFHQPPFHAGDQRVGTGFVRAGHQRDDKGRPREIRGDAPNGTRPGIRPAPPRCPGSAPA